MCTAAYEYLVCKCLDEVIEEITYVFKYQDLIDTLDLNSKELERLRLVVQRDVREALDQRHEIKEEFTNWIEAAGEKQQETEAFAKSRRRGCTDARTAETHSEEITKLLINPLPRVCSMLPKPPPLSWYWEEGYVALGSRKEYLQKLTDNLLDFGESCCDIDVPHRGHNFSRELLVIGIYGVEGVGKTILAKQLAADMERGGTFDVVAVVTGGVPDIQQQIAERIGFDLQVKTVVERAGRLRDTLSGMGKVLIILDNVDGEMKLSELGIPRPVDEENVCRIVVVSRSVNVCKAMGSHMNLEVHPLTGDEPLNLLYGLANEYRLAGDAIQNARGQISRKTAWLPAEIKADILTSLLQATVPVLHPSHSAKAAGPIVMLDAGALQIEHVDKAQYWSRNTSGTEATLIEVWWLHIQGRAPRDLRPATNYGAYFVYKLKPNAQGFRSDEVELIVGRNSKRCCLDPTLADHDVPTRREGEEWLEIEMGSFYNDGYSNAEVVMVVKDHNTTIPKSGLIVRGIELRPRTGP